MRVVVLVAFALLVGFDHDKHDAVSQSALTCVQCHTTTKTGALAGKPRHATCFGKCHGPTPKFTPNKKLVIEAQRMPVCTTCHSQATLGGTDRKAFAASVPASPADHALAIGHKRHAAIPCAQCHQAKPPATHARCSGCHVGTAGKGPPMSLCTSCHLQGGAEPLLPDAHLHVGDAFSHAKHATRGPAGAKCATCHVGVTETDASELPHATKQLCAIAGCHDAKAAFSTTVQCTKCHQELPVGKFDVARPTATFSHGTHLAYVAWQPCTSCHDVAKTGEVSLPGHAECTPCHADDFGARVPTTCAACHDATEPWRKLAAIRPALEQSEFGASLDHGKHAKDCTSCHNLTTASVQLRPPRGHSACTGKTCHATSGGALPQLTSCAECHELGVAERREEQRTKAAWTVRPLFDHAKHPSACVDCHVDMTAPDLMSLATPPKATCVKCHDGRTSFKITGTGCKKCHPAPKKPDVPVIQ